MKKAAIFDLILSLFKPKTSKANTSKSKPLESSGPYVFVTPKGKRFHYDAGCPGLRNAKPIIMSLSKAKKAGYTACDKCCYDYLK